MLKERFVVMDARGNVQNVQDNAHDALSEARFLAKKAGGGVYADLEQLEKPKEQNPPPFVELAMQQSGLPVVTKEQVMALSLEEAHARLRVYLPAAFQPNADPEAEAEAVKAWATGKSAAQNLFKKNTKMGKDAAKLLSEKVGYPISADSHGMSLLPHFLAGRKSVRPSPQGGVLTLPFGKDIEAIKKYHSANRDGSPLNWCVGSSKGCRATCLVFSGQNQVADEAIVAKHALSAALRHDPLAFMRLMVEGIRGELQYRPNKPTAVKIGGKDFSAYTQRFIRLNVYQDLPWEGLFPDLFSRAGEDGPGKKVGEWIGPIVREGTNMLYDYTKVAGRDFTPGYWLTFSFAGGPGSVKLCRSELERGRNVAVVFVRQTKAGPVFRKVKTAMDRAPFRQLFEDELFYPFELEDTFGKVPVLNGDAHDIRPLDHLTHNGPAIIGLDFKAPQVKVQAGKDPITGKKRESTVDLYSLDDAGEFVMRIEETPEGAWLLGSGVAANMLTERG